MHDFIESHLLPGEQILERAQISRASILMTWFSIPFWVCVGLVFILTLLLLIVPGIFLKGLLIFMAVTVVLAWLTWSLYTTSRQRRYIFSRTNLRVIGKAKEETFFCPLQEIYDIRVEQSIWGKLFHYGHINVITYKGSINIQNIEAPHHWRNVLLNSQH